MVLEQSRRFRELEGKMIHIPNGVRTINVDSAILKSRIHYVSRMDKKHSSVIMLLILGVMPRLARKYPQLTLGIVGSGGELKRVEKAASEANRILNREAVKVFGYEPDMRSRLQDACLVLGVGRVALESLACGIPVMLVNGLHLGPVVNSENFTNLSEDNFVAVDSPPPDEDSLLHAIDSAMSKCSSHTVETSRLADRIQKDSSAARICERTVDLYTSTLEATPSA
jgi:glycosyltransferase involved in cell wall biosynthesis